jgi:copper transport protein
MRGLRLGFAALFAGVVALVALASPAWAHAQFVTSTPADGAHVDPAPDVVTLRFTEDVSLELGGVRVLNTDGERVDDNNAQADGEIVAVGLRDDLADGAYVVAWNVVSADSHPISGAFSFVVGAGQGATDDEIESLLGTPDDTGWRLAAGFARFAAYAGTLLAAGGLIFVSVVDRRSSSAVARFLTGAAAVGALGLLLQIPLQAAIATERGWSAVFSTSRWVDVLSNSAVRWSTAVGLVGLVLVVIAVRGLRAERPTAPVWMGWVGAGLAFASFAITGHTRVRSPAWLVLPADAIHVAAAGIWFGGLVLIAPAWARRRREGDAVAAAGMVDRFSQVAAWSAAAVGATGLIMAWSEVGSFDELFSTRYGRTLVAKLAAVAVVAALAAYNHWRLLPDIRRTGRPVLTASGVVVASPGGPGAAKTTRSTLAWRRLDSTVRAEVIGMVVVLAITSALVSITPARDAAAAGGVYSSTIEYLDGQMSFVVDPGQVGTNEMHVYLLDSTGRPDDSLEKVTIRMSLPDEGLGPIERETEKAGAGHWSLDTSDLTIAGDWEIEVVGQVSRFEDQTVTFEVPVRR